MCSTARRKWQLQSCRRNFLCNFEWAHPHRSQLLRRLSSGHLIRKKVSVHEGFLPNLKLNISPVLIGIKWLTGLSRYHTITNQLNNFSLLLDPRKSWGSTSSRHVNWYQNVDSRPRMPAKISKERHLLNRLLLHVVHCKLTQRKVLIPIILARKISPISRFALTFCPSVWGWYAVLKLISVPSRRNTSLKNSAVNLGSRSQVINCLRPWNLKTLMM